MANSTKKNQLKHFLVAASAIFLCLLGLTAIVLDPLDAPRVNAALVDTETPTPTVTLTATTTPTITETATATPTITETATVTPTFDPCSLKPPAPKLRSPADGAQFSYSKNEIELRWKPAACANTYRYQVFQDSKNGKLVSRKKGLHKTNFTTKALAPGHKFFWYAQACNAAGCAKSRVRDFTILAMPTPRPRPTESRATSTPAAELPSHLANYQGPSVYLNSEDPVYYFDCTWKWRPMGDIVLVISDGFAPGESVTAYAYEISSGVGSMSGRYIAESNGWVRTAINTQAWAGGHYHLIFTGSTSNVSHCGHFDLDHGPGKGTP